MLPDNCRLLESSIVSKVGIRPKNFGRVPVKSLPSRLRVLSDAKFTRNLGREPVRLF